MKRALPYPVDTWQVPDGDFCEKGGRFGPHQFEETVNSVLNRFENKIAYVAYFNAGVRVLDISDPYNMRELAITFQARMRTPTPSRPVNQP